MAQIQNKTQSSNSAADKRLLQSLIQYLRQRNITRSEIPFNDPVLQAKTLSQINAAFDTLESTPRSPIESYYEQLMGDEDFYSTTPTAQLCEKDWTPISELRWQPLSCSHITIGATMMIFTPVDLFTIMWCRIELERSIRFFYGAQSLLSRDKTDYYLAYTANKTARKQNYRLRSLGNHKIAKGLPIILGTNSSFSGKQKRIFENLNPLPTLRAIPSEQSEFHDFVVQVMTYHGIRNSTHSIQYEGRKFTNDTLRGEMPTVQQDTTSNVITTGSANDLLIARAQRILNEPSILESETTAELERERVDHLGDEPPARVNHLDDDPPF
jgi:hypothetical protein